MKDNTLYFVTGCANCSHRDSYEGTTWSRPVYAFDQEILQVKLVPKNCPNCGQLNEVIELNNLVDIESYRSWLREVKFTRISEDEPNNIVRVKVEENDSGKSLLG